MAIPGTHRACQVLGLEPHDLAGRRKDQTTARLRELVTRIGVEAYGLRVKDLAEAMEMNAGSASRALARAGEREREEASFHEQRLALEAHLAELEFDGSDSKR